MLLSFSVLWAMWVISNVALMLAAPLLAPRGTGAFTNGVRVVIPTAWTTILTGEEIDAIAAHEAGHIAHRHAVWNLLRRCFFVPRTPQVAQQQEIEADNFAAQRGHGPALASALRKVSSNPFDRWRASRLG